MAVVLAALSLPPLSALAWCGLGCLSDGVTTAALARTVAGEAAGAAGETFGAEPGSPEAASLLLTFGVRRAEGPAADVRCPSIKPKSFAAARLESNQTAVAQAPPRPARARAASLRAAGSARAAGPRSRVRYAGRGLAPLARTQEKRPCDPRRLDETPAETETSAAETQDVGAADLAEPNGQAPASCQAEAVSGRSRTRL